MKVYIVTDGDYSDYHIVGVYTDKEKAEKYTSTYSGRVEEHDTDPDIPYPPKGYKVWFVGMLKNGTAIYHYTMNLPDCVGRCNDAPLLRWDTPVMGKAIPLYPPELLERREKPKDSYDYKDAVMYVYVFARNKKHAVKIANEKRAQLIANGQWERNALPDDGGTLNMWR